MTLRVKSIFLHDITFVLCQGIILIYRNKLEILPLMKTQELIQPKDLFSFSEFLCAGIFLLIDEPLSVRATNIRCRFCCGRLVIVKLLLDSSLNDAEEGKVSGIIMMLFILKSQDKDL